MRITTLVENVSTNPLLGSEHGLSLWIETGTKKILFDSGATDLFDQNATVLGVDISTADLAVLSHGHWDHSGGLNHFLKQNKNAPIYLKKEALGPFYSKRDEDTLVYAGLDDELKLSNRFVFSDEYTDLGGRAFLFGTVDGSLFIPTGNKTLYLETERGMRVDPFEHEHYLGIEEGDERVLISGCSHRGIANIVEQYKTLRGLYPTRVIGGFHLYSVDPHKSEEFHMLKEIATLLLSSGAIFYTGHCTGEASYQILKEYMKDSLEYLPTGGVLEFV